MSQGTTEGELTQPLQVGGGDSISESYQVDRLREDLPCRVTSLNKGSEAQHFHSFNI